MADEAEKVINLSLCKMAESRTTRRGGTSLHKHLLISTVLTKARSAYFETWYMNDTEQEIEIDGTKSTRVVDLNSSYQEIDFPLDDDDDDDDEDEDNDDEEEECEQILKMNNSPYSYYNRREALATLTQQLKEIDDSCSAMSQLGSTSSAAGGDPGDDDSEPSSSAHHHRIADRRRRRESESEIELPSDILNCVEKLNDISAMSFDVNGVSDSSGSIILTETVLEPHEVSQLQPSTSSELTYLDLDSRQCSKYKDYPTTNNQSAIITTTAATTTTSEDKTTVELKSLLTSYASSSIVPTKRRRTQSWEEEPSENEIPDSSFPLLAYNSIGNPDTSLQQQQLEQRSFSMSSAKKRVKLCTEPGSSAAYNYNNSIVIEGKFRTKKPHFEEDEQDESDDDPFLGDMLSQESCGSSPPLPRRKSDQRVPSASGGSSSDEDQDGDQGESEMEIDVDQITNLVQFFSFNKQQQTKSTLQLVSNSSLNNNNGSSSDGAAGGAISSSSSTVGLTRSLSTPDLCSSSSANKCLSQSGLPPVSVQWYRIPT